MVAKTPAAYLFPLRHAVKRQGVREIVTGNVAQRWQPVCPMHETSVWLPLGGYTHA